MSQSAVSRIWRAFALKPHQLESFKLSTDPLFIEKVRDIVGLYLNPPEAAVVLCVDEKTPDPGTRAYLADPAAAAGDPGAGHPRLPPRTARPTSTPPSTSPRAGHRRMTGATAPRSSAAS